jgi:hypothetical protein
MTAPTIGWACKEGDHRNCTDRLCQCSCHERQPKTAAELVAIIEAMTPEERKAVIEALRQL